MVQSRSGVSEPRAYQMSSSVANRQRFVSFMDYDSGFIDHETGRLEPFDPRVLPVSGINRYPSPNEPLESVSSDPE